MDSLELNDDQEAKLNSAIRQAQIIVAALTMGCVFFMLVVLFLTLGEGLGAHAGSVLTPIVVVFTVGCVTVRFVVIRQIVTAKLSQLVEQGKEYPAILSDLLSTFVTKTVIGSALLEGPCFLALVAVMVERSVVALGIAVFLIAAIMVLNFPTRMRFETWLGDVLDDMRLLREQQFVDEKSF